MAEQSTIYEGRSLVIGRQGDHERAVGAEFAIQNYWSAITVGLWWWFVVIRWL